MPKLINKTSPDGWVKMERELLSFKGLKPTPKLIYSLLRNLAQSCENVFPTYFWIAEHIGYETEVDPEELEGKTEEEAGLIMENKRNATNKFVKYNLAPLLHLGLIRAVPRPGKGYDYEIYDFDRVEKSTHPVEKNLPTTGEKNLPLYRIDDIEKLERETTPEKKSENIFDKLFAFLGLENSNPLTYQILRAVKDNIPVGTIEPFLAWVISDKSLAKNFNQSKLNPAAYSKWFYSDYLAAKTLEAQGENIGPSPKPTRHLMATSYNSEAELDQAKQHWESEGFMVRISKLEEGKIKWSKPIQITKKVTPSTDTVTTPEEVREKLQKARARFGQIIENT